MEDILNSLATQYCPGLFLLVNKKLHYITVKVINALIREDLLLLDNPLITEKVLRSGSKRDKANNIDHLILANIFHTYYLWVQYRITNNDLLLQRGIELKQYNHLGPLLTYSLTMKLNTLDVDVLGKLLCKYPHLLRMRIIPLTLSQFNILNANKYNFYRIDTNKCDKQIRSRIVKWKISHKPHDTKQMDSHCLVMNGEIMHVIRKHPVKLWNELADTLNNRITKLYGFEPDIEVRQDVEGYIWSKHELHEFLVGKPSKFELRAQLQSIPTILKD